MSSGLKWFILLALLLTGVFWGPRVLQFGKYWAQMRFQDETSLKKFRQDLKFTMSGTGCSENPNKECLSRLSNDLKSVLAEPHAVPLFQSAVNELNQVLIKTQTSEGMSANALNFRIQAFQDLLAAAHKREKFGLAFVDEKENQAFESFKRQVCRSVSEDMDKVSMQNQGNPMTIEMEKNKAGYEALCSLAIQD